VSEAEHEGKGPVLPESVRALLEAVPAGIAVVGSDDGHVHFWNQAALRQLGIRGLEGPPHTLPSAGNRPAPGGALEVQTARGALRAQVYALPSPCQDLLAVLLLPASD